MMNQIKIDTVENKLKLVLELPLVLLSLLLQPLLLAVLPLTQLLYHLVLLSSPM